MADKQYRIQFRCPNPTCNCKIVEEVMVETSVFSPVINIADFLDGSVAMDYGRCSHEDGRVLHYACLKCEYVLRNESDDMPIDDPSQLLEWLRKHNMLEEI